MLKVFLLVKEVVGCRGYIYIVSVRIVEEKGGKLAFERQPFSYLHIYKNSGRISQRKISLLKWYNVTKGLYVSHEVNHGKIVI